MTAIASEFEIASGEEKTFNLGSRNQATLKVDGKINFAIDFRMYAGGVPRTVRVNRYELTLTRQTNNLTQSGNRVTVSCRDTLA